jgi:hypothetical protein
MTLAWTPLCGARVVVLLAGCQGPTTPSSSSSSTARCPVHEAGVDAADTGGDTGAPGGRDRGTIGILTGPAALAGDAPVAVTRFGGDDCGTWVSPVGDADGDGDDDVLVLCEQPDGGDARGLVHVAAACPLLDGVARVSSTVRHLPFYSDVWLGTPGDLDGDGRPELGYRQNEGTSTTLGWVVSGAAWDADVDAEDLAWKLDGRQTYAYRPPQVVPDTDGDGGADLLIAMEPSSYSGNSSVGTAMYVIPGSVFVSLPPGTTLTLADLPTTLVTATRGLGYHDLFGGAGDVDGDGLEDLVASFLPRGENAPAQAGEIRLALSRDLGEVEFDEGPQITGPVRGILRSALYWPLPDLDGDGKAELMVQFVKRADLSSGDDIVERGVVRGSAIAEKDTNVIVPWPDQEVTYAGVTCDLDGDGSPEWVSSAGIWAGDSLLDAAPMPIAAGLAVLACLGDIDGDGTDELAVEG